MQSKLTRPKVGLPGGLCLALKILTSSHRWTIRISVIPPGKDKGNGAALVNHSRRNPSCFLLREKGKIWIVAGIEGIRSGEELTNDYGSEYYPRRGKGEK
jgi:SET domain